MSILENTKKGDGAGINTNIPPTDVVLSLKKQGIENSKIVQTLQGQGYGADIIYDALTQAEVKEGVEGERDVILESQIPTMNNDFQGADDFNGNNAGPSLQLPTLDSELNSGGNMPNQGQNQGQNSQQPAQDQNQLYQPPQESQDLSGGMIAQPGNARSEIGLPQDPYYNQQSANNFNAGPQTMGGAENFNSPMPLDVGTSMSSQSEKDDFIERIEEIAEAIVDEKWNEVVKTINKIIDWKDRMETKIDRLDQQFVDLKDDFKSLSNSVVGKVGEYDKNISKIGIEIQAMEKVFQKVLPSLTENIHELQKITEKAKERDGKF